MAGTHFPTDSNTKARSCSSHTLSQIPVLTPACLLSVNSPPDVSFPFRGQRKLNQICPRGSLCDGERGEGGSWKEEQASTIPPSSPPGQAFTNSGIQTPLQSSKGRAGQQVQMKSPLVEAASVEGAPRPAFQPLKVTRLVWENQEAQSPAPLGSPCPAGAAECDLPSRWGSKCWGQNYTPSHASGAGGWVQGVGV